MKILNEKSLEEGYVYNVPYNEFIKEHAIPREMPVTAHFYLKKDLALWMDDKVLISDTMHGLYLQKGMNHVEYFDSEIQGIRVSFSKCSY